MAVPYPFLDWPGPIPLAHRGGASEAPENTLPAFEQAVRLGYRYVETDVHLTSDGVLLAFHDDHLDRVTDRAGEIAALPWSEVQQARVDGREPIPKLDGPADQHRPETRCGGGAASRGDQAHRSGGPGLCGVVLGPAH
jgi:glycerophosphoryl diester phosphodiesterase